MHHETTAFHAGIPACAKSYFGRWLEAKHNFIHIDLEQDSSFELWWLHGDWMASKKAFDARNDELPPQKRIAPECFDVQQSAIVEYWDAIEELFGTNIISTLGADGSRLAPENIFSVINAA